MKYRAVMVCAARVCAVERVGFEEGGRDRHLREAEAKRVPKFLYISSLELSIVAVVKRK